MNKYTWKEITKKALVNLAFGDKLQKEKARLHILDMADRLDDLGKMLKKGLL